MKKTTLSIYLALSLVALPGLASAATTSAVKIDNKPKAVVASSVKYEEAFNKALAAYLQKDYEKTIQEGIEYLQYDPNGDLHSMVGDSFFKLNRGGNSEKNKQGLLAARVLMEKVVKMNPKNKPANSTLGFIYSRALGVPEDKEKAFNYFKVNSEQGVLLDTLNAAQVAQAMGKYDIAFNLYENVLNNLPNEDGLHTSKDKVAEVVYSSLAFIFYDKENKKLHDKRFKYLPIYLENPHLSGGFLLDVALDYKNGNGVPKSNENFFKILKKVADKDLTSEANEEDFFYRLAARDALTRAYLNKEFYNEMEAFNYAFSTSSPETIGLVNKTPTFKNFAKVSGYVVDGDLPKAIPALKEEMKKGNKMAEPLLALFDLSGYGDAPSEKKKKAAKILEKAVYQGNYVGFDTLVMANLIDDVLKPDIDLARKLMSIRYTDKTENITEADKSNLYLLEGLIDYKSGNKENGIYKVKSVADKGNLKAMMNLYMIYTQEGKKSEAEKYLNLIEKTQSKK